jgi:hypothetical protein
MVISSCLLLHEFDPLNGEWMAISQKKKVQYVPPASPVHFQQKNPPYPPCAPVTFQKKEKKKTLPHSTTPPPSSSNKKNSPCSPLQPSKHFQKRFPLPPPQKKKIIIPTPSLPQEINPSPLPTPSQPALNSATSIPGRSQTQGNPAGVHQQFPPLIRPVPFSS